MAAVCAFTSGSGQGPFHACYHVALVREYGAVKPPGVGHRDAGVGDALYRRFELRDRVAARDHRRYLAAEPAAPDGLVPWLQYGHSALCPRALS